MSMFVYSSVKSQNTSGKVFLKKKKKVYLIVENKIFEREQCLKLRLLLHSGMINLEAFFVLSTLLLNKTEVFLAHL